MSAVGTDRFRTAPESVHETLKKYMLADGLPVVFDFEKSRGCRLWDSRNEVEYLDLFSFFASQPIGFNHPRMADAEFAERIGRLARTKPANSDLYTQAMADFVETFAETTVPPSHRKHLFFIEGGALAVENAMKAAFDWKYRKNEKKGGPKTEQLQILHFETAFHGRSGYTMSVTCTADPRKYMYFPKFDWPRAPKPPCPSCLGCVGACQRPANEREEVVALEDRVIADIEKKIAERKDLVAAILVEAIQGEGGDNHFSPEFMKRLRAICDREEMLLIFDEIQTGMGLTGTWWAFEQLGVTPDIFTFGKKSQVCGIAANARLDEVDSVFKVSSRINSTWGGNLVDMVRSEQFIKIIRDENLLENARTMGARLRAGLDAIAAETPKITGVRGRGLMLAFDLPSGEERDAFRKKLYEERVIMIGCGTRSVRTRPVLDIKAADVDEALARIRKVAKAL